MDATRFSLILALLIAGLVFALSEEADEPCADECECRYDVINEKKKRVLDCSNRKLEAVPSFMKLAGQSFDYLFLNKNKITNLQSRAFRGLTVRHLDISDNQIRGVSDNAFKSVDGLQELIAERAGLSSAPLALSHLKHLKILKLKENSINVLNHRVFEPLKNLHYLDVSNNRLDFTYPFTGFQTLKQLKTLKLAGCEIDNMPEDGLQDVSGKLKVLDMRDNNIRDIPEGLLQRMRNLEQLDLENNPIKFRGDREYFQKLQKLKLLKLGQCDMGGKLNTSAFRDNWRLKTFKVHTCNISKIDSGFFHTLNHLQHLDIGGNNIKLTSGLLSGVAGKLLSLGLHNMSLKEVPRFMFGSLSRVKNISLAHNKITSLPAGAFSSLQQDDLRIQLNNNEISKVNVRFLRDTRRPITVDLSHNSITELEFLTGDPCSASRATINLQDNPLNCHPICGVLLTMQKKVFDVTGTCKGPRGVIGYQLKYTPGVSDPSLGYVELNATNECAPVNRQNQRYLCCEERWVNYNSTITCGSLQMAAATSYISFFVVLIVALLFT